MKKRLLAMLLALVLVFSLLPSVVIAEGEEHIHCMCGANSEKDTLCAECDTYAVVWTAWDGTTAPSELTDGNYYLTQNLTITYREVMSANIAIDLCGRDIIGENNRAFYIDSGSLSITDCTDVEEEIGQITGFANESSNAAININDGATLNIYNGKITGNTSTSSACGVINVSGGGTLNMYGGEISGNTAVRGTIKGGTTSEAYWINILGGTITSNESTGTGNLGGGAGIYSFSPVTIGGDAKVFGNTGADTNKNQDIFLRNDSTYTGAVVLSTDKPLEKGAQINYGLWTAEADTADLQKISGSPAQWKNVWVSYNGQKVGYADGVFFVDDGPADADDGIYEGGEGGEGGEVETGDHIHCLCGAETTEGETCADCGSEAVKWTAWGENAGEMATLPKDGYYYLTQTVTTGMVEYKSGNTAICLHGNDIVSLNGYKIVTVYNKATLSLCECNTTPGKITGTSKETYGLTLRVNEGGVLNLYGGHVTGNSGTANGDGIIYVDKGDSVAGGTFNMYGGEISGNTARRGGAIYTASGGTYPAAVRVLGGTITGNHSTGTGATSGGGGILSFFPVEIGGDAVIYGNTSALEGGEDIYLRNDTVSGVTFEGALVVSDDVPLKEGAQINYNLKTAESDLEDLQSISGTPANWDSTWVTYDGQKVGYNNGKFYVDTGVVSSDHVHCMCGAETTEGVTCASCGTEAVQWQGITAMPKATAAGYYYLKNDVTVAPFFVSNGGTYSFCLCGHTMTSAEGKRMFDAQGGSVINFTDCAEEVGSITGATGATANGMVMRINANSAINFYNGKITGNYGTSDGIVYVAEGTTELPGGIFTMYGGEISDNTCRRGTIYTALGTDGKLPGMIRILGGTVTGNTGTGTGNMGGGAGVYTFYPIELGGDAKIYGNTATMAPADLYIRDDQGAQIVLSDEVPLTGDARIAYGTKSQDDTEDLQLIVGEPTSWNNDWITYDGAAVKYKDGIFFTAAEIVISGHNHGGQSWISMTEETGLVPTKTGYYVLDGDVQLPKQLILSNVDITICLNGHTLTAADGTGHFDLQAGAKLTICDCTAKTSKDGTYTAGKITGGNGAQGGFARMREGSELYLYDGIITGNQTAGNGGVVYMNAGTSELPGAIFHMYGGMLCKNYGGYGGAVRLGAPVGDNKGGTFRMEGGWICDNESPNYGGALHAAGNATIELIGGVIENNVAKNGGGGLSINGTTTVNLSGTVIRNNSATTWGGGVYIKTGAVMNMTGGEISGNSSKVGAGLLLESVGTTLNLSGGKICGNKAGAAGGAGLYASTKTIVNMTGGEVSGNVAEGPGGGMILAACTANFTGGKVSGNQASGGAGMRIAGSEVYLGNIVISENESSGSSGGVYVSREGSICSNVIIDGAQIINNTAKSSGGGMFIYMNGNVVTMESGKINGNKAADGGGICAQREVIVTINGGEICSNTTTANGGGYYASIDSTFIFNGGLISGNYAGKGGGGVYCLRSKVYLNRGSISNNYTETGSGAGVYVSCAKAELNGTWITNNTCKDASGAGVMVSSGTMKVDGVATRFPATLTINAGRISGNFTPRAGGGLLLQSADTVVNMYGGKITENTATKFAGGVYVGTKTQFNMHGGEISYNVTENDVAGGIRFDGGGGNLTGGEIHHNVTSRSGGGMVVGGADNKVTMKNVKIYANEAKVGGGFVQQSKGCQLIMENCEIYDNKATQEGAGAYIYTYCDYYATNCHFYDNVCQGNGGGIWNWATSNVYLTDCVIENNQAVEGQGGGIWTRGDGYFISGCTIRNNTAAGDGGGVYAGRMSAASDGFKPHMNIDTTVIKNNVSGGQGGGAYMATGAMCKLNDVQFLNNTAAAEAGAIWAQDEFSMLNVTATGNKSGGEGYAIYLDDSEYDGHSYINGLMEMGGNMQIHDNPGGDLYLGEKTTLAITELGITEDTKVNVTLHSGLLTQMVWGEYNYEGGNLVYTITYGNRSITDPEIPAAVEESVEDPTQNGEEAETPTEGEKEAPKGSAGLIIGIVAVVAVIAAAAIIIVVAASKKKKVTK